MVDDVFTQAEFRIDSLENNLESENNPETQGPIPLIFSETESDSTDFLQNISNVEMENSLDEILDNASNLDRNNDTENRDFNISNSNENIFGDRLRPESPNENNGTSSTTPTTRFSSESGWFEYRFVTVFQEVD